MTKLSAERLRDIAGDVDFKRFAAIDQVTALCAHIDALEAENAALAKVADHAVVDVKSFESCLIEFGTDRHYAAIRVQPMKAALKAAGRLP